MAKNRPPTLDEIVARPYARVLSFDSESGRWCGSILEFPGVVGDAEMPEETLAGLETSLRLVVDVMLERGNPIPEPIAASEYSGRFSLRLPPNLHAESARLAAAQGVSLNRFLSDAVARYVGSLTAAVPALEQGGPVERRHGRVQRSARATRVLADPSPA